jgi:hypothetical protein
MAAVFKEINQVFNSIKMYITNKFYFYIYKI